jgi:antitoxin VapB
MRITVNIPDEVGENLKRAAQNQGTSISGLVASAVEHYLVVERRRALGYKLLDLAGKGVLSADVDRLIEEGRRDDRA